MLLEEVGVVKCCWLCCEGDLDLLGCLLIGCMFSVDGAGEACSWFRVPPNGERGEDHHAYVPEEGRGSNFATYRG